MANQIRYMEDPDLELQRQALEQRQAYVNEIRKQRAAPQSQMVGTHLVTPSWTQHLASALGPMMGAYQQKGLNEESKALSDLGMQRENEAKANFLKSIDRTVAPEVLPEGVQGPVDPAPPPMPLNKVRANFINGMTSNYKKVSDTARAMYAMDSDEENKNEAIAAKRDEAAINREAAGIARREKIAADLLRSREHNDVMRSASADRASAADLARQDRLDAKQRDIDARNDKANEKANAGAATFDTFISSMKTNYDNLLAGGGITSNKKNGLKNLASSTQSSGPGQFAGRVFGTKNQTARNEIEMSRPLLITAISEATGMHSKQLDSNADMKLWMSAVTDPTKYDYESNVKTLGKIEDWVEARKLARGKKPTLDEEKTGQGTRDVTGKIGTSAPRVFTFGGVISHGK